MAIPQSITSAVGDGRSPNRLADVVAVKTLLTIASINQSQASWNPGAINGSVDANTLRAIKAFQMAKVSFKATGVVEPSDLTMQRLKEVARSASKSLLAGQPKLVAESRRKPGKNEDGTDANDMMFGDYTKERIKNIRWNFEIDDLTVSPESARRHFDNFKFMATSLFSMGELKENILNMIEKFRRNEGGTYSDPALERAVSGHTATQAFLREFERNLSTAIAKYRGDISQIKPKIDIKMTSRLVFNTKQDILWGLTIATNDIWAWNVEIVEYAFDGIAYNGKYKLTLYDHFGLDEPDVDHSKTYGNLQGFRSWFILQHLVGFAYKPFMTVIEIKKPFSGRVE